MLKNRRGVRSVEDLLLGPDGNMKYPNFKLACLSWGFISSSTEYFTAMFEALQMGWHGKRLLKFYASIIAEGDATNIREIWEGVDKNSPFKTEEEELFPHGFKERMITVPKTLREKGYPSDWKKLPKRKKETCEVRALKQLAYYLDQLGKDYPVELPELSDKDFAELGEECLNSHIMDSNVAKIIYERQKSSEHSMISISLI